ncbi:MAG: cysteine desulfurase NifS [Oscillospiraceae bacterium]|nr:cysteine desulfurase NifS [Oscillospiraceae bacterium]
MKKRFVYADNAATTKVSNSVYNAMLPYLKDNYANPSSIYSIALDAKAAIDRARKQAADAIGALPEEIYFTSCGTESDNWAIKCGAKLAAKKGKNHIITTNFEHHAVLNPCKRLEKEGFKVTYLPVNSEGLITVDQLKNAITDETGLVTIMYVNNEIGTILPIPEIATVCKEKGILFHTDAVQAIGHIEIDVKKQNIDMLSLSGHKIFAPKGIGLLYIKKGIRLPNLLDGGGQERGLRGGTENIAYILALGQALKDITKNIKQREQKVKVLRDKLLDGILSNVSKVRVNGSMTHRVCGNLNVSFEGVEGESILLLLDAYGICASSGSACTSGSLDPSHVLLAIGLPHAIAHGSLRISILDENDEEDIDYIIDVIPKVISRLREMSPIWKG